MCVATFDKSKMNIIEIKENITRNELEWIEKHYILNNPCINKKYRRELVKNITRHKLKKILISIKKDILLVVVLCEMKELENSVNVVGNIFKET